MGDYVNLGGLLFIVEFEDGTYYSEFDGHWDSLPKKNIKKLIVNDPITLKWYTLEGYDSYMFTREGMSGSLSGNQNIAIWVGGFYEPSGDGNVLKIVLKDIACQGSAFGYIPSKHKDWYPMNRKALGFGRRIYKTNS